MWGGATRRRILGLLAVGLLAATAGLTVYAAGLLNRLERDTVDVRFSLRGHQPPPSHVVLVGIDNDSLGRLPRYPFSRRLHARVLENLHAAGARLVVYDVSFDRPTTPAADEALYEAARRAAPVVFATSLISPSGATEVLGGNANLAGIGDQAAAADFLPDPDGVLRHTLDEVNGLPTVAATVARALNGHVAKREQLQGGWIDFRGPPGTLNALSFVRVLRNDFDAATVRGKVVVVGAFVALVAYGGHGRYGTALADYNAHKVRGQVHYGVPPRGAVVYWNPSNNSVGHVGISLGNGLEISTYGFAPQDLPIQIHKYNYFHNYLGWAMP